MTNAEHQRNWRKRHPEQARQNRKRWRESHPEKVKEYNHQQYLRRKALKQKGADTDSAV